MFRSGANFEKPELNVVGKKFKDALVFFNEPSDANKATSRRWLKKAREIQWDYKNIVQGKGGLYRLK
jgi:hypothetical protein